MKHAHVRIPASLEAAIEAESRRTGRSVDAIVTEALSRHFETELHTVFQVSTSGALVAGVYEREASVETILAHGDFGLGTFTGLDGEMIVLEGRAFHADANGVVTEAPRDAGAPFAIVTRFQPERETTITGISGFQDLGRHCDPLRDSGNIFYAIRLDGRFRRIKARSVQSAAARHASARRDAHAERIHLRRYRRHAGRPVVAGILRPVRRRRLPFPLHLGRPAPSAATCSISKRRACASASSR